VQVENKEAGVGCTFLSVPFKVLRSEAGSLNLLSQPGLPFSSQHTAALEQICKAIGRHIEALRLKARVAKPEELEGVLTWENFRARAQAVVPGARASKNALTLWRLEIGNAAEIESLFDLSLVENIRRKVLRALVQSVTSCGFVGVAAGNQILVLCETKKLERSRLCFQKLIERYCTEDTNRSSMNDRMLSTGGRTASKPLHTLVMSGIRESFVRTPKDGETFEELLGKSSLTNVASNKKS
jgi:hypothetical protein